MSLKNNLDIFVITYNRAIFLDATLEFLANSQLKDCQITILNNCSSDNTSDLYYKYKKCLSELVFINHQINIGANANILRAFEYSDKRYTWILCDDDQIDLTNFEDVVEQINLGSNDLIHVGAHPEYKDVKKGFWDTPRNLISLGYNYFKFGSFLPCNIFKTEVFKTKFIIAGYNNIVNSYPHMPYLINAYEIDSPIYIAKNQVVTANMTGQSYSHESWLLWWIGTSKLLKSREDVRIFFFDHFGGKNRNGVDNSTKLLCDIYFTCNEKGKKNIKSFVLEYFNTSEKIIFFKTFLLNRSKKIRFSNVKQRIISIYKK